MSLVDHFPGVVVILDEKLLLPVFYIFLPGVLDVLLFPTWIFWFLQLIPYVLQVSL